MKLIPVPFNLTLRHAFTIARASDKVAKNVLIKLQHGNLVGIGEASPDPYYGQTQQTCLRALKRMGKYLNGRDPFELEDILADLKKHFPKEPSAIAAVDVALHDLITKKLRMPLWRYWGLNGTHTPQTSFTIGIDTLEKVTAKLVEAEKYPILKIKLGTAHDLEIMREVRRLAPKKTLRVDANCGWTVQETIAKAKVLEKLGVEFIEQPIPPGNNAALKKIKESIGLELMTDESSLVPSDIPSLRGCVHGINIKLVKCGGLREAMKMIHLSRACDLKIMIGCMIESSVLISAAANLTPLVDYADLDGNLLITDDPYRGVTIDQNAKLRLINTPGIGLSLHKNQRLW